MTDTPKRKRYRRSTRGRGRRINRTSPNRPRGQGVSGAPGITTSDERSDYTTTRQASKVVVVRHHLDCASLHVEPCNCEAKLE